MAEKRRILKLGGKDVPVYEVEIVDRSGEVQFAQYVLSDGSVIKVSNPVAVVYRMEDDTTDGEGNPVYLVKLGTSVVTVTSKKGTQDQGD